MDGAGEPTCSPVKPSQASDGSPPSVFGRQEFKADERNAIRELLQQKLGKEHLATRPGSAGASFTYVESWKAIELANQIFGFNGWSSAVVDITPDYIEQSGKGRYSVGVTAVVKVMLKDGTYHEDVGYGMAEHPKKGSAIENAKKEAVSDARKRALRLFGNALGNCLYDKEHLQKLKSAKKGDAGYLPSTVSNPAHDAEKVSVHSEQTPSLPLSRTSSQPAQPSGNALPSGYNISTANIAGRQQQSFASPVRLQGALATGNTQTQPGVPATSGETFQEGYDDEAFLSIVMSESAEVSHNTAKRASPEGYQMQQPFSNGSSAQRGIRPHPQQHFGGIPPDKRPRYDV